MDFTGLLPPGVETNRDRFDLVEALSGWSSNDILRGDDRGRRPTVVPTTTSSTRPASTGSTGWPGCCRRARRRFTAGNIILGGAGNDLIEGRGGDDIIDGDAWLNIRLSVRNPADPATEIGSAEGMNKPYLAGNTRTLQTGRVRRPVDPEQHRDHPGDPGDANGDRHGRRSPVRGPTTRSPRKGTS